MAHPTKRNSPQLVTMHECCDDVADLPANEGQPSSVASQNPFDPADWIARATDAGAAMFVRDDELWVGSVAAAGRSEQIEELKAELDDAARAAVRSVLASRGLVAVEA